MSVLNQRQTDPSLLTPNWRRPAGICLSLAVLGALLGGAIWMQTAGPVSPPKTHGYPLMPTAPLKIGFYDLSNRKVLPKDPVLQKFPSLHLDYLLLQNVPAGSGNEAARIAGMTGADVQVVSKPFGVSFFDGPYAQDYIIARHPLDNAELVSVNGRPFAISAESRLGDRVIRLVSASPTGDVARPAIQLLQKNWEGSAPAPAPLPPIIIGLDDASRIGANDLVEVGSGWFDASAAFWDKSAAPPPGHLLFSSGWSLTGGQVVRDPHDPLHRVGWVVTTAGAAPPATQAAGEGED